MQSLTDIFANLGYWNWVIAAFALAMVEMIVPGVHFLWFGLAAVIVAILTALTGFSWEWQFISFGVLAVATVFIVTRLTSSDKNASDTPDLNERSRQYIGRTLLIEQAIVDGRGRVRVGDTLWAAEGPDLPAGTAVKVIDSKDTVLIVEAA